MTTTETITRAEVCAVACAEIFSGASRRLTRIELVERDEIVRCLTEPGTTVAEAAEKLGISRATLYRRINQYGIRTPGRDAR